MSTDTQLRLREARLTRRDLPRSAKFGATSLWGEDDMMAINRKYVYTGFNAMFHNQQLPNNIRSAT